MAITYAWSILHKVQIILIKCLTLKVLILVLEFHNVTAAIHVHYAEQEQEPLSILQIRHSERHTEKKAKRKPL